MDIIKEAKKVLEIEYKAIKELIDRIGDDFVKAIELLDQCKGRVIITGMGKSGLIGKKIAATLASTGTPAFFLHPAEAIHGDLGIVTPDDIIIAISNSGNSNEIIELLPFFKRFGIKVIAFTGNKNSQLAQSSDICLDISVKTEACPFDLVPTTSTTATLSMGDALAVALLKKKGFNKEDFAILHPGGSLGKSLLLRVKDLMHTGDSHPSVKHDVPLKIAICEMTSKGLGMTVIVDEQGCLAGLITDGDLRRILETEDNIMELPVQEVMIKNPKTIKEDILAAEALRKMELSSITSLIITDDNNRPFASIHLHDILKAGIA